jgi:hypothetical protein
MGPSDILCSTIHERTGENEGLYEIRVSLCKERKTSFESLGCGKKERTRIRFSAADSSVTNRW